MTFFLGFVVLCLVGGVLTPKMRVRDLGLALVALCALVTAGYFFFDLI